MNPILVPVNFRADYENLLKYAESVAVRSGAPLVLFYAGGKRFLKGAGTYTYDAQAPLSELLDRLRGPRYREQFAALCQHLKEKGVAFTIKFAARRSLQEILRESEREPYELMIMGTHRATGLRGYFHRSLASRLVGRVRVPLFVVPSMSRFNEIQHITYAVDLADYDPVVIRQVKSIARLFDAKLTIAHVNTVQPEDKKEHYLFSLERTITDTLDYPKIYYRFFDHADPLGGLKKLVNLSNTHMVAMISRRKQSWRSFFSDRSITRKMTRELPIPVLAFGKQQA
ncbi:MAG: universal stress protein [Bacteroidetes bacterium]|nr:MAG: universal stress protein [Bacteroidota bacterium]